MIQTDPIMPLKAYKLCKTNHGPLVKPVIVEIMNIIAGLILAMGILPSIPAVGKSLEKLAKWLGRFQTIIGIIAIIIGIWGLFF